MLTTMMTSMTSRPPALVRCSSQDFLAQHPHPPSPTQPRSNSFVASRRCGIVSEQDALRLADSCFEEDTELHHQARRLGGPRLPPITTVAQSPQAQAQAQAHSSPWPAPVLRRRSTDAVQRRPLSTGYLPTSCSDATKPRVQGQATADAVDAQLRLQNVALLPNRQFIQQRGGRCQWSSTPKNDINVSTRPDGDQTARQSMTPDTKCRPPIQPSLPGPGRVKERQQLDQREAELRSTMERNETAILQAMDDQRRIWELSRTDERVAWQRQLSEADRRTDDVRQALTERIRRLEVENATLLSAQNRGQSASGTDEGYATGRSRSSSDNADEAPPRPTGTYYQLSNRIDAKMQMVQMQGNFTAESIASSLPTDSDVGSDIAASRLPVIPEGTTRPRCQHCHVISGELERVRREFDAEREQWLTEKRRVIAYQKLIQTKYSQLAQRCALLESSSTIDGLNHSATVEAMTSNSEASSRLPRLAGWNSSQAQSSAPMLSPKLIPFGQSIET